MYCILDCTNKFGALIIRTLLAELKVLGKLNFLQNNTITAGLSTQSSVLRTVKGLGTDHALACLLYTSPTKKLVFCTFLCQESGPDEMLFLFSNCQCMCISLKTCAFPSKLMRSF